MKALKDFQRKLFPSYEIYSEIFRAKRKNKFGCNEERRKSCAVSFRIIQELLFFPIYSVRTCPPLMQVNSSEILSFLVSKYFIISVLQYFQPYIVRTWAWFRHRLRVWLGLGHGWMEDIPRQGSGVRRGVCIGGFLGNIATFCSFNILTSICESGRNRAGVRQDTMEAADSLNKE